MYELLLLGIAGTDALKLKSVTFFPMKRKTLNCYSLKNWDAISDFITEELCKYSSMPHKC